METLVQAPVVSMSHLMRQSEPALKTSPRPGAVGIKVVAALTPANKERRYNFLKDMLIKKEQGIIRNSTLSCEVEPCGTRPKGGSM